MTTKLQNIGVACAILISAHALSGCFAAPYSDAPRKASTLLQKKDLVGTYKYKSSSSTKLLALSSNGTFKHTVEKDTGKTFTSEGHWKLDTARRPDGGQLIEIASNTIDNNPEKIINGEALFPVDNVDGKGLIVILVNEDVSYERQ